MLGVKSFQLLRERKSCYKTMCLRNPNNFQNTCSSHEKKKIIHIQDYRIHQKSSQYHGFGFESEYRTFTSGGI